MRKPPLALPLALLLCSLLARAEDGLHISSGVSATAVLELYTAQGCSSCPPADRWLSALREHPALWHGLIPWPFMSTTGTGWVGRTRQPRA
ncbi:DUF1223 domain-containing protein [Pseudomonas lalucatii]|nr:DUF1223 domain-containing protein [Pseudomonas lalucatii]